MRERIGGPKVRILPVDVPKGIGPFEIPSNFKGISTRPTGWQPLTWALWGPEVKRGQRSRTAP